MQKIVAVALAGLTAVLIRLMALVLSMLSVITMTLIGAIVIINPIVLMIRGNYASGGEEDAGDQREKWKSHDWPLSTTCVFNA